ncbi:hypothetical protein SAMN05446635_2351 [Burkholderia sp. OK233]|nr:hypothetical protein SAMN05446635_2351 [Burkholderia sp. OK233]
MEPDRQVNYGDEMDYHSEKGIFYRSGLMKSNDT